MEAAHIAFRMMRDSMTLLTQGWEQAQAAMVEWQAALIIERIRRQEPV
jgi:hypothetical protein